MATSVWDTVGMVGPGSGRDLGKNPASITDHEYLYELVNKVMPLANWELHPGYSSWGGPSGAEDAYYVNVPGRYSYYSSFQDMTLTWDNWWKGVRGKDGKNGDLLVTVNVAVPQNMTDEQRDALQTYADLVAGEDPRKDLSALAGNSNG